MGAEGPLCRSELQTCTSCPSAHQPRPIPSDTCPPPREAGPSGHTQHPRETGWAQEGSASGLRPETSAQSTPRGEGVGFPGPDTLSDQEVPAGWGVDTGRTRG